MTDSLLASLAAKDSIRRLIAAYCACVGRRDADSAGDLFTPDARVTIADLPERVGRDEIVEGLRRTVTAFTFLHQKCDTGLIDVDGDAARAQLGVMECNRLGEADSINLIFGAYEDEYRLFEARWRFHRRRFTLQFRAVLPASELRHFPDFIPAFAFTP